jgi:hypothetical protein
LEEVEREIRQHLELELLNGNEDKSQLPEENDDVDAVANDIGKHRLCLIIILTISTLFLFEKEISASSKNQIYIVHQ